MPEESPTVDVAYIVLLRTQSGPFFMLDRREIVSFDTAAKGVAYFEDGYARSHNRGAEASTSATLFWTQYKPIIVPIQGEEELNRVAVRNEDTGMITPYSISSIAGRGMAGIQVQPAEAERLIALGVEPRLIHNDMLRG